MKFNFIYTFFFLSLIAIAFSASSSGRANVGWGNTGAPGDELTSGGQPRTCQTCHGVGSPNGIEVTQTFELTDDDGNDVFTTGYTPGETYNAKLTVNTVSGSPEEFGFQILCLNAPQDQTGPEVSEWTAVSNNVAVRTASNTNRTYVEHMTSSTSNVFSMTWVAPAQGSGELTFYVVSNGVNNNGGTGGDGATGGKFTLTENEVISAKDLKLNADLTVFPNPVETQLSVKVSTEETGNYNWSIIDMQGRYLKTGQLDLPLGESLQNIQVMDIAAGLYQFQLEKDGKRTSQTLVKK